MSKEANKTQRALSLALEALYLAVRMEPSDSIHECPEMFQGAITALRNELAKQEQGSTTCDKPVACANGCSKFFRHPQPQQRTWVGLTDLEMAEFVKTMERGNFLVAIYDIEKKLKEKNT